jgi:hypothetical protein
MVKLTGMTNLNGLASLTGLAVLNGLVSLNGLAELFEMGKYFPTSPWNSTGKHCGGQDKSLTYVPEIVDDVNDIDLTSARRTMA